MDQTKHRLAADGTGPGQQAVTTGMRRKTAQSMNLCPHRITLPEHAHPGRTIHQLPPQRAAGLKSGKHHMGIFLPEPVLEVMANAAAVTHAATGDDDRTMIDLVQRNRILHRWRQRQHRQKLLQRAGPEMLQCTLVAFVHLVQPLVI